MLSRGQSLASRGLASWPLVASGGIRRSASAGQLGAPPLPPAPKRASCERQTEPRQLEGSNNSAPRETRSPKGQPNCRQPGSALSPAGLFVGRAQSRGARESTQREPLAVCDCFANREWSRGALSLGHAPCVHSNLSWASVYLVDVRRWPAAPEGALRPARTDCALQRWTRVHKSAEECTRVDTTSAREWGRRLARQANERTTVAGRAERRKQKGKSSGAFPPRPRQFVCLCGRTHLQAHTLASAQNCERTQRGAASPGRTKCAGRCRDCFPPRAPALSHYS